VGGIRHGKKVKRDRAGGGIRGGIEKGCHGGMFQTKSHAKKPKKIAKVKKKVVRNKRSSEPQRDKKKHDKKSWSGDGPPG